MTKICCTIAGSDASGGAGIQADLKTFEAWKVFGTSVITLVTAQNTRGIQGLELLSPSIIQQQLRSVMSDFTLDAAKIGALGDTAIINAVADVLDERPIEKLVVDPVMVSKHGDRLFDASGEQSLVERIFPHATLITPNLRKASVLLNQQVVYSNAQEAAHLLNQQYKTPVLITGGQCATDTVTDWFSDGKTNQALRHNRVPGRHQHGAGCTLSAAIAAGLAHNMPLPYAILHARGYILKGMLQAPDIGHGEGPLHHAVRD